MVVSQFVNVGSKNLARVDHISGGESNKRIKEMAVTGRGRSSKRRRVKAQSHVLSRHKPQGHEVSAPPNVQKRSPGPEFTEFVVVQCVGLH
jgi:hypothetical protein